MACGCEDLKYQWTISLFGKLIRITAGIREGGEMSIGWNIMPLNTVRRTSPGFVVIERCSAGTLTAAAASHQVRALLDSGVISTKDQNSDGEGYIDYLIRAPWVGIVDRQFDLLGTFAQEGFLQENDRLLKCVLRWVGEGPHLCLLKEMLRLFDFTQGFRPETMVEWPMPFNPGYIDPFMYPDRLFIEAIGNLAAEDSDSTDKFGMTPLMYAASYGDINTTKSLLQAGADPFLRDGLSYQCMWYYAFLCSGPGFLEEVLKFYMAMNPDDAGDAVKVCLWIRMMFDTSDHYGQTLEYLLQTLSAQGEISWDGFPLLHVCRDTDEAQLLLKYCHGSVNQQNRRGYTPMMVFSHFPSSARVFQKLIEHEADVHFYRPRDDIYEPVDCRTGNVLRQRNCDWDAESAEITNEQEELARRLDVECASYTAVLNDVFKDQWVEVLARRAVLLEHRLQLILAKQKQRRPRKPSRMGPELPPNELLISETPLRYIDRKEDLFTGICVDISFDLKQKNCQFEHHYRTFVDQFATDSRTYAYMMGRTRQEWDSERQEMLSRLHQEIQRLRKVPLEARGWDVDLE
ncbi:hypothetical protein SLS54_009095 [Diplodia seriata]